MMIPVPVSMVFAQQAPILADTTKHYSAKVKFTDKNHYQFTVGTEVLTMERTRSTS